MRETVFSPAINGHEARLDAVLDELRAIRQLLTPAKPPIPADGDTVELREPAVDTTETASNLFAPLRGNVEVRPKRGRPPKAKP